MNPGGVDIQLAQFINQRIRIAAGGEVGRCALQHSDLAAPVSQRWNQRGGGCTGSDHYDVLAGQVSVFRPVLRMDDFAFEALQARPFGGISLSVLVVALAHPEKTCSNGLRLLVVARTDL